MQGSKLRVWPVETRSPQYTLVKGLKFLTIPNWRVKSVYVKIEHEKRTKRAKWAKIVYTVRFRAPECMEAP